MSGRDASQDTLSNIRPLFESFGITRMANVTGLDRLGVPVFMICRPNSRSLAVFQGKGLSDDAAKISGVMEAIECFHAENLATPSLSESFNNLKPVSRMKLDRLSRLNGRVFNESAPMLWLSGRDLISGQKKFVPHQCVHMDCTAGNAEEQVFISDTTGLAAGATMTQAVNHAICESIERDAQALWSLTNPENKRLKKIRLRDIHDDFVQNFLSACDLADVAVAAWDITTDIGVPSFLCKVMAREYAGNGVRPAYGSSAHLSPIIALQKAVAEAAQSRITFIAGARDDQYATHYQTQLSEDSYRRWYTDVIEQPEWRSFYDIPDISCVNPEGNQALLLDMLAAQGLDEVVVVDLTRQEYSIPVVKVIVPGLEGVTFSGQRLIGARGQHYFAGQGGHA